MTAPLGGIRRDRKRLKRCAHRDTVAFVDAATVDEVVVCRSCGASTRIASRTAIFQQFAQPRPRKLPDRIARKATDAALWTTA